MKKVWTYLSSKALSASEIEQLKQNGQQFVNQWTAHDNPLQADFSIYKNRILVFKVDEEVHNASGCSIDKLLRFVKETEKTLDTQLLNRLLVAVDRENEIEVIAASKISELLASGNLNKSTPVLNTAVSTDTELANWQQELGNTWLSKYLPA